MAWSRSTLVLATTLAASDFHYSALDQQEDGACGAGGVLSACLDVDRNVSPRHVIFPLLVPAFLVIFTHVPTLLLASRRRVWGLWTATLKLVLVFISISFSSAVYLRISRAWGYAFSLHFSILFITQERCQTLLFNEAALLGVQTFFLATVLLGAWRIGPPLPAWDAPGLPGCCGAVAHMAAWATSETLGKLGVSAITLWGAGSGMQ
jgi:hypothetical protein